jgi:hypothetical protein
MILKQDGSYMTNKIFFDNKEWTLIGSKANGAVLSTLDSFKSDKGEYITLKRERVLNGFKLGKITI